MAKNYLHTILGNFKKYYFFTKKEVKFSYKTNKTKIKQTLNAVVNAMRYLRRQWKENLGMGEIISEQWRRTVW